MIKWNVNWLSSTRSIELLGVVHSWLIGEAIMHHDDFGWGNYKNPMSN